MAILSAGMPYPAAFKALVKALQNGYEAAAGPHLRTPIFRKLEQ